MTTFDCTDIKATLSGLVDGEVDAETRHLAERHLAGCAACRALLSEAESLNELIVSDARTLSAAALPAGFMDGVLSRTVYARAYEQAGWNWTSWLGWVAAAACLVLAASIFFLDRVRLGNAPGLIVRDGPQLPRDSDSPLMSSAGFTPRSWTFDGEVSEDVLIRPASFVLDDATRRAIDEQLETMAPTAAALRHISAQPTLSDNDALTLHSTALLLQMIAQSDLQSFSDIERVRQIAEYDELPQRLGELRPRLHAADRAVVLAAESLLLRIVNGPMDLNDLRLLHDTAASMNMASQISAIGAGGDDGIATSL
jgi:hypothetical protein